MNILIVEDHPMVAGLYKGVLADFFKLNNPVIYIAADATKAHELTDGNICFSLALIDYNIPPFLQGNVKSGSDITLRIREYNRPCKVIMITAHSEPLLIYDILHKVYPDGLIIKSDLTSDNLCTIVEDVLMGDHYLSDTVKKCNDRIWKENLMLDQENRKIVFYMLKGYKIKDLSTVINLSSSTIQKRIIQMKKLLGVSEEGNLIKEFVSRGLV
ncbi:hypothetical protein AM493_01045 [Flavobacterium akiainvivens]|uniref:Response regulatory domain-containing protein n=1 Tax=Flavobacterium akiainvivens TaxID=1202724 RepID=A0A0M8M8K9_9FLAO|nr:response regulator [Flavobacterium akiainvivens]KOS04785.1 hypothetical protein AM493_01045 [Flavobacterium akiainvivens]SFQ66282.1 DNA-binding response regulator, NarL/FixJ family, contains REC and HTH domains [Flavobacterium akiainvivens]